MSSIHLSMYLLVSPGSSSFPVASSLITASSLGRSVWSCTCRQNFSGASRPASLSSSMNLLSTLAILLWISAVTSIFLLWYFLHSLESFCICAFFFSFRFLMVPRRVLFASCLLVMASLTSTSHHRFLLLFLRVGRFSFSRWFFHHRVRFPYVSTCLVSTSSSSFCAMVCAFACVMWCCFIGLLTLFSVGFPPKVISNLL
uniref:Uncharacterized protein n=1 Tax=Ixodes ricinus TaxID=34613 RepID=A0A6B0V280_IXORI